MIIRLIKIMMVIIKRMNKIEGNKNDDNYN